MIGPPRPPLPAPDTERVVFTAWCGTCRRNDCDWTSTRRHNTTDLGGKCDTPTYNLCPKGL